jgi:hypothetical protein
MTESRSHISKTNVEYRTTNVYGKKKEPQNLRPLFNRKKENYFFFFSSFFNLSVGVPSSFSQPCAIESL